MKVLDRLIGSKKEIEEQEYPEEFTPNEKAKAMDPDIKEFLQKKEEREAKKDGKEDTTQEDIPEEEEQSTGPVSEDVEEIEEAQETNPGGTDPKITYTKSFNIPVTDKNIETSKKLLVENVNNGFVIAFQAGTYVDKKNVENVKRALKYFIDNNYKVIIATEQVEEISDEQ